MKTVNDIMLFFDQWAPKHLAETWDNVGLQIGNPEAQYSEIVIALEADEAVLSYLKKRKNCCVITHHPLFFKPLKHIRYDNDMGEILQTFLNGNHHLFSAHTNLDAAPQGVNDCLITYYNLDPKKGKPIMDGFGKYFENINLSFNQINDVFPATIKGSSKKTIINTLGFCAGSGHGLIDHVIELKCDAFITGEITYHDHVKCRMNDVAVITLGHKESENIICEVIQQKLQAAGAKNTHIIL